MAEVKIFLSTVSAEFRSYRDALRHYLDRHNVTLKVQESFIANGTPTLDMLDQYIRACDVVIHLVGDMTGAMAQAPSVAAIRRLYPDFATRLPPVADFVAEGGPAMSYTQWEAWLALYHGKRLIIAVPAAGALRDPGYALDPIQQAAQQAHLARLASIERHPGIHFRSADHFAAEVWRSGLLEVLVEAGLARRVDRLPHASLGALFKGRDTDLAAVADLLGPTPTRPEQPAACVALWGLGGVGKTRLALEYAWRRGGGHHARLLVGADSPESLHRNLAALCAADALNLPEQAATEEARQHAAVVAWLRHHPGWLLILDNADDEAAAAAVEALRARLGGGHILVTTRLPNWSAAIHAREVDVLAPADAADFLLQRTASRRKAQPDDAAQAALLADELGGLALALEQAGAYIARLRIGFADYLARWQHQRDKVLEWFDPRLMQYPRSVAITWQTSFDQLGEPARRLLQRLAWLAPAPIPASLLDVPIPGEDADLRDALAELEALSLVRIADDGGNFGIHRLVQAVTRRGQAEDSEHARLVEALQWVDDAFVGDPEDVRDWPTLDPLADHAVAVAEHGTTNGLTGPCTRLFNEVGCLLHTKAQYTEAEPLMRRALSIAEASFGPDHPTVASHLSNFASLLQDTNHLAEAEPLMRRALSIDEARFGPDHPTVAIRLNNLAQLLQDTDRLAEAEPLMRRALVIAEASFGPDHPRVATSLNNLATLLQYTDRLAEAEPLMCRALSIAEASFGPDHPDVARHLNNLAQLLQATDRLAEAEPLKRRALSIAEASFGPDHPTVAGHLNNLASLLQATDRLAEAEPLMRRALSIDEASFGPDHPDVARDLNNVAGLLYATNRLAEAEPLMHRALTILVRSIGPDHPNSQVVAGNYRALLQTLGKTEAEIAEALRTLLD